MKVINIEELTNWLKENETEEFKETKKVIEMFVDYRKNLNKEKSREHCKKFQSKIPPKPRKSKFKHVLYKDKKEINTFEKVSDLIVYIKENYNKKYTHDDIKLFTLRYNNSNNEYIIQKNLEKFDGIEIEKKLRSVN